LQTYIDTVTEQLKKEFDAYNDSVSFVCETTKISQKVFNDTYAAEPSTRIAVENELSNQFLSPFIATTSTSKERAIEILRAVVPLALEKLKEPAVLE